MAVAHHSGIISMSSNAVHNRESWNAEFRLHGNESATQMRPPSAIEEQIVGLYIIVHHQSPDSLVRIVINQTPNHAVRLTIKTHILTA